MIPRSYQNKTDIRKIVLNISTLETSFLLEKKGPSEVHCCFRVESISFWRHMGEIKVTSNNLLSVLEKLPPMMLAPRGKGLHL